VVREIASGVMVGDDFDFQNRKMSLYGDVVNQWLIQGQGSANHED